MTSNLEREVKCEKFTQQGHRSKDDVSQVNYSTLINFWNNNQVIHMAGPASKVSIDKFLKTLQKVNQKAKVYQSN